MIEGHVIRGDTVEDLKVALADLDELLPGEGDGWVWFDVVDPTVVDLAELQKHLGLHPLAIEDARHRGQAPKAEFFGDHIFVVLRPLSLSKDGDLHETEIHIFASKRFLLTLRFTPAFDLSPVLHRCRRQPEMTALGMPFALYAVFDTVTDGYLRVIEQLEDLADRLEDHVFGSGWGVDGEAELQKQLLRLRRGVVKLRRRATPMRQAIDLLESQPFMTPALAPYFRDVLDHLMRIGEMVDAIRDLIMTLLDVRTTQAANRMNEVMKSLTAWATILLVPTLFAGIWGMNFRHMPELDWRYGYLVAIMTIVGSAFGLYAWFKWKKRWL